MRLQYVPLNHDSTKSIYVNRRDKPHMGGDWHFHEEFELIYFLRGQGMRIVGDNISHFQDGELVLVGKWLPHLWRNEKLENDSEVNDFIVVKFLDNFNGVNLFGLPEFESVRSLLERASQGIKFSASVISRIEPILLELIDSKSTGRIISFLKVLELLAQEQKYELLSSKDFVLPSSETSENRLQKVINYISLNYANKIGLEKMSEVACMTPPSFCRFFKNSTNKTFSSFLNELRVSKACHLLINGEESINQICYQVGFNSITNFNRTFKLIKNLTPSAYREKYSPFNQSASFV